MYSLDVNFLKDRQLEATAKTRATPKVGEPISWRKQLPLLIGAGAGLTLLGLTGLLGILLNLQMNKTRSSIAALEAEISQINAKTQQLKDVETKVQALEGESQALVTVFNQIKPWSSLLQELRRQVPVGVGIDSIEEIALAADTTTQEPARTLIKIRGFAPSHEDVNNFLLTLQSSEFVQAKKAQIESVEKKAYPAKLKQEIPNVKVEFPQAVAYTISFELNQTPASQLLIPLSRNGAVGLVTRIKTLEQKGVLKP